MAYVQSPRSSCSYVTWLAPLLLLISIPNETSLVSAKAIELGSKLPELIVKHPERNWLVQFYAPWCYHCQQLEPIFNKVAEKVYDKLDNVVVGRVDCSNHAAICDKYNVNAFPTILFIKKKLRMPYLGEKDVNEIADFADRLSGPDVATIDDCKHLDKLMSLKKRLLISTISDNSSAIQQGFLSLSTKPDIRALWWFYQMPVAKCQGLDGLPGVYVLKKDLRRSIRFTLQKYEELKDQKLLQTAMKKWLDSESFQIYGPFTRSNYEHALRTNKLLVIAVLDEYKPARRLTELSRKFDASFEDFAKKAAQYDDDIIFFRCVDRKLIDTIAIDEVPAPNVMLLRSDYTYSLLLTNPIYLDDLEYGIPKKLNERSIKLHITAAKLDELNFGGGNTLPYRIIRFIFKYCRVFKLAYSNDPFLLSILSIIPVGIVLFVLWNTNFLEKFINFHSEGFAVLFRIFDPDDVDSSDDEEENQQNQQRRGNNNNNNRNNRRTARNNVKQD